MLLRKPQQILELGVAGVSGLDVHLDPNLTVAGGNIGECEQPLHVQIAGTRPGSRLRCGRAKTGGSPLVNVNGSLRDSSSAPAPENSLIVDRFSPPEIQRLRARNSNRARVGFALTAATVAAVVYASSPLIRFRPEPNLCFADQQGRIVTAGGTTSWHDLALHIISHHVSPGEAMRIAKVYLLKWHDEGQLPFEPLVRPQPHSDEAVRGCELRLQEHFSEAGAVAQVVSRRAGVGPAQYRRAFKPIHGSGTVARPAP